MTGHRTLAEVQRYTAEADQKRLAKAALEGTFGDKNVPPRAEVGRNGNPPEKTAGKTSD